MGGIFGSIDLVISGFFVFSTCLKQANGSVILFTFCMLN